MSDLRVIKLKFVLFGKRSFLGEGVSKQPSSWPCKAGVLGGALEAGVGAWAHPWGMGAPGSVSTGGVAAPDHSFTSDSATASRFAPMETLD